MNKIPINYKQSYYLLLLAILGCTGCSIRQNILFKTPTEINPEAFRERYDQVGKGYTIEPFDRLAMTVFTSKGERFIDPNREFEIGEAQQMQGPMQGAGQIGLIDNPNALLSLPLTTNNAPPNSYLVRSDGTVALPMVGDVTLKGLKLYQADSLLALLYNQFYDSTFVVTQYLNKRVVLMGALGDKVVPIRNENMTLLEVLAMAGNFQMAAKANSLRVIRGDLSAPSVQFIDLTTIEGMRKANLFVQPNDVIYVEPRRRIDRETIADINSLVAPITTLITVILSITLLIQQLERN